MLPGYELSPQEKRIFSALQAALISLGVIILPLAYFGSSLPFEGSTMLSIDMLVVLRDAFSFWLIIFGALIVIQALRSGQVFSARTARAIRLFGILILVQTGLVIVLNSFQLSRFQDTVFANITIAEVTTILVGLTIFAIGHIFTQAVRISDENRQIV